MMANQEKIQKLRELLLRRGDIPGLFYFIDFREKRAGELFSFIVKNLPIQISKTNLLLDVGCGTGAFIDYLHQKGLDAVGIDVDTEKLRVAFANNTIAGDSYNLPFEDETFDFVISIDAIEHMPNQGKAIAEMLSKLKVDGELLVLTNNRLSPFDSDTKLFFINLMPKALADRYIRFRRKKSNIEYDIKYPTYVTFPMLFAENRKYETKVIGVFSIFGLYVERYGQLKVLANFLENLVHKWQILGGLQLFAPKLALHIKKVR